LTRLPFVKGVGLGMANKFEGVNYHVSTAR